MLISTWSFLEIRMQEEVITQDSEQKLLSSSLLSRNFKIKIYRTTILPVFLYGCKTLSLTFREERMLRVFENRVLRRIYI
jgi:hypothetical protein